MQVPGELHHNYLVKKLKVSSWSVVLKMSHSGGSTLNLITVCYSMLAQEWMLLLKAFVLFPTHSPFAVSMSDLLCSILSLFCLPNLEQMRIRSDAMFYWKLMCSRVNGFLITSYIYWNGNFPCLVMATLLEFPSTVGINTSYCLSLPVMVPCNCQIDFISTPDMCIVLYLFFQNKYGTFIVS